MLKLYTEDTLIGTKILFVLTELIYSTKVLL